MSWPRAGKRSAFSTETMLAALARLFAERGFELAPDQIRAGYAPPPQTLYISLNRSCQCRCEMCNLGRTRRPERELPLELLEQVVNELAPTGTYFVLYRQEPLLYSALVDGLDVVERAGARCQVTTNGLLLARHAELLAGPTVDRLWVSLDGPPEVHDAVRHVPGAFAQATRGIRAVASARRGKVSDTSVVTGVSVCVQARTYRHLPELVDLLSTLPVDLICLNHLKFCDTEMVECGQSAGTGLTATSTLVAGSRLLAVEVDELAEILASVRRSSPVALDVNPRLDSTQLAAYYHETIRPVVRVPCLSPWFSTDLLVDGTLEQCAVHDLELGKLNGSTTFLDLWNSAPARQLRLDLLYQSPFVSCGRCSHVFSSAELVYRGLTACRRTPQGREREL
jgi:hypothetical protein